MIKLKMTNKMPKLKVAYSPEVKKLRIKVLNHMKKCKVKPLKIMFPNLSIKEYNKIPSTDGFHIIWTKDKISYNFASIYPDGVINQVLKLEGLRK